MNNPRIRAKWRRAYKRRISQPHGYYRDLYRRRLWNLIKARARKERPGSLWRQTFGCSKAQLIKWIESNWLDGMSWDNYGREKQGVARWQVDHVTPVDSFDLSIASQRVTCWHYRNLRPMWAADNRVKAATLSLLANSHNA